MFKTARIRLTITYSLIFFAIFWSFSIGLYVWMGRSLGESYITQVIDYQEGYQDPVDMPETNDPVTPEDLVTTAGDVALINLRNILIDTNLLMIILVPLLAWLLTDKTLQPIKRSYEQQRQFVSDASHELKTPLTIMQSELELALKKTRTVSEYKKAIISTNDEVDRLRELVESLLTLTRSDQNQQIQMEDVDLTDIILETVSSFKRLARKNRIKLQYNPPRSSIKIHGSAVLLRQLLTNLIDNAIKFTPAGGEVTISLNKIKDKVRIRIVDTGIGMSKEQIERAFERFYRADESRTKQGFGLGLAICQAIAEQHGGSIAIESIPNEGTTVTISLES